MASSYGSSHVTPAGGNVFADLGFDAAEAEALKAASDNVISLRRAWSLAYLARLPLLPKSHVTELIERTCTVFEKSCQLRGPLGSQVRESMMDILQSVNVQCLLHLDGIAITPAQVEAARKDSFSEDPATATAQHRARAYIGIDTLRGAAVHSERDALNTHFLTAAHNGLRAQFEAGGAVDIKEQRQEGFWWRDSHFSEILATPSAIGLFADRASATYGKLRGIDQVLYTIASAHNRFACVQPFESLNGEVIRMQTQCAMVPFSHGVWSITRGFARTQDEYRDLLARARADSDSDALLWDWCAYFIRVCEEEVDFMTRLLDQDTLGARVYRHLRIFGTPGIDMQRNWISSVVSLLMGHSSTTKDWFLRIVQADSLEEIPWVRRLVADGIFVCDKDTSVMSLELPTAFHDVLLPGLWLPSPSTAL